MKILALIIIFFNPVLNSFLYSQNKGDINVEIQNIMNENGTLRIALFTENDKFLEVPSYSKDIPADGNENIQIIFEDIPYGTYAISIYHDLDNNEELDTNFIGIPKEPVGFSNDHQPKMGPPRFKGAAFNLSSPTMNMVVELYNY